MKLTSLTIKSFRSIEDETFNVAEIDGTHTFTLIGINESGKSSFLKAVSLVDDDDEKVIFPKDYFDEEQPISIFLNYELETQEEKDLKSALVEKGFEKDILSKIKVEKVAVCATFEKKGSWQRSGWEELHQYQESRGCEFASTETCAKTCCQTPGFTLVKYLLSLCRELTKK